MLATLSKPKTGIKIDPSQYPDLIRLINGTYSDRVESIAQAEVDEKGNIIAIALDGAKRVAFKAADNDIAMMLLDGNESARFAKTGAAPKKKKNCSGTNSFSCGFSCISKTTPSGKKKVCHKDPKPEQKALKNKIVKEAKAAKLEPIKDETTALPSKKIEAGELEDLPVLPSTDKQEKIATGSDTPLGKSIESSLGTPKGQILRQSVQDLSDIPKGADADITAALATSKKNVLPVFISQTGKDSFDVVGNGHIAAAAKKAKLDFVQTVSINEGMAKQLAIESKYGIEVKAIGKTIKDKPETDSLSGLGNPTGQILRQPVKFINGKSSAPAAVIDELAEELKKSGKNVSPVYIHEDDKGNQRVVGNAHILEAARKAKLDFVQTVIVDKKMAGQLAIESKQGAGVAVKKSLK